ncbi:MAG: dephospho-CoA kinase [Candidatus Omnitrophica bacterium]|nr:dephospho-CoA kinase [Candidatus Omnitrophota bacterium]
MVIGITGSFCTGKSEVAHIFKELGAKIIDLDKLAHATLRSETESFRKIIKEFTEDILVNRRIDRPLLAQKVFMSKKRLNKLNSIIHPIVIRQMLGLLKRFSKRYKIIVVDVPLLFEAGMKRYFDYIIVVKANKKIQMKRAMKKTGLSKIDILRRINSQWPIAKKIKHANFVIDNSGSIRKTQRQVKEIWEKVK